MKTYSELIKLESFEDRFNYLSLDGKVGADTFGFDRYLNQALYKSPEWKKARQAVILRDNGCDLGVDGYDIERGRVIIHHMNPISKEQVLNRDSIIFDPEFLITTTHRTHNAIHYGDEDQICKGFVERTKNDTIPWKQKQ